MPRLLALVGCFSGPLVIAGVGGAPEWRVGPAVDAFPGQNAHQMPAHDLEACKQFALEHDMGCFVESRGQAYFRQKNDSQCIADLRSSPGSTIYVFTSTSLSDLPTPDEESYYLQIGGMCATPITSQAECDLSAHLKLGLAAESEVYDAQTYAQGCIHDGGLGFVADESSVPCSPDRKCICVALGETASKYVFLGWAIFVVQMVLLMASLAAHRGWICLSYFRTRRSKKMFELDTLTKKLVTNFAPSVGVNAHEFRGISKYDQGISLDFKDLGLALQDGRRVLDGVTGNFPAGNMVAIMGPSGCGKTTCMNVLCGKATYGKMVGEVKINGKVQDVASFKNVTGFVPQDDTVFDRLTVREQITYSAELRNDYTTSKERINLIVEDVLRVLQIGHIQDSIVGSAEERGISGGQRKRVNIGLELAAAPCLFFLDEPTSGLDSTSSLTIINSLKKMTELNMTITMVIHQPRYSLFSLFDQVLLLGKGGRTVYQGPASKAAPYFEFLGYRKPEDDNAADWMMDVIEGEAENTATPPLKAERLPEVWEKTRDAGVAANDLTFLINRLLPHESDAAVIGAMHSLLEGLSRSKERVVLTCAQTRVLDSKVIQASVADQWETIDADGNSLMDLKEFRGLLDRCTGGKTDPALAKKLFDVACTSATGLIKKNDLAEYIFQEAQKLQGSPGEKGSALPDATSFDRIQPGPFRQFRVVYHRRAVQFWRDWRRRLLSLVMIVGSALAVGHVSHGDAYGSIFVLFYQLGVAVLTTLSCLSVFSDRALLWRETSTGISLVALFAGRLATDCLDVLTQTVLYTFVYYVYTAPDQKHPLPTMAYLTPTALLVWVTSGWGYLVSLLVHPRRAKVAGAAITILLCTFLPVPPIVIEALMDDTAMKYLLVVAPSRWSMQMIMTSIDNLGEFPDEKLDRDTISLINAYKQQSPPEFQSYLTCALVLLVYGLILRVLCLVVLRLMHKKV